MTDSSNSNAQFSVPKVDFNSEDVNMSAPIPQLSSDVEVTIKKEAELDSVDKTIPASNINTSDTKTVSKDVETEVAEKVACPLSSKVENATIQLKSVSNSNESISNPNESTSTALAFNSSQTAVEEPQFQAQVQSKKKDRTMAEFVLMMDQYTPIIPDLVTDYFLTQAGFDCEDYRVKRVLALATQKFVSDIATDAYQYAKIRNQVPKDRKSAKGKKTILMMEDLSPALSEYGINVKKPDYYI